MGKKPPLEWTVVVCLSFPCLWLPGQELCADKALPLLAEGLSALHLHLSSLASIDEVSWIFLPLMAFRGGAVTSPVMVSEGHLGRALHPAPFSCWQTAVLLLGQFLSMGSVL